MGKRQFKVRADEAVVELAKEKAKALGMSLTDYVGIMLNKLCIEVDSKYEEVPVAEVERKKEIRLYLSSAEHEVLKDQAQQRGWSVTKEVRWRVISTISNQPKLNDAELQSVNGLRHAIDVIGRNINYGVRKGMIDMNTFVEDVATVRRLIEQANELIETIRTGTKDRWSFQRKS